MQSELQKIETGTILSITPQIGPDGKLTLDMEIEVSDVIARGDQGLPVVSRRIAKSTVVKLDNAKATATLALLPDAVRSYVKADEPLFFTPRRSPPFLVSYSNRRYVTPFMEPQQAWSAGISV